MADIKKGTEVVVTDAFGRTRRKRALSPVIEGARFPALWACSEEEWEAAQQEGRQPQPEPFPWPARSVRLVGSDLPVG